VRDPNYLTIRVSGAQKEVLCIGSAGKSDVSQAVDMLQEKLPATAEATMKDYSMMMCASRVFWSGVLIAVIYYFFFYHPAAKGDDEEEGAGSDATEPLA